MDDEVYFIEVSNIDKDAVRPLMRDWDHDHLVTTMTCRLSIAGRLAQERSAAYLESRQLAEELLLYWLPSLKKRPYGDFNATVKSESAGAYKRRWCEKRSLVAKQLLKGRGHETPET